MGSEANWERLVRAVLRWERLVAGAHGQPVSGRASASAPVAMGSGANCERLARAALRERLRAGAHGLAASGIAGNVPYNIIPLDAPSIIPEVKAAVSLLKCYRSLPKLPYDFFILATWKPDMLDLLQYVFGFQKGNVSNQREHLILLLANTQSRPGSIAGNDPKSDEGTVHIVFSKCLENYIKWCSYLSLCPFWNNLESGGKEKKLLYLCLYFLIWGEASNIRFLPECLCYIFHYMAGELEEILSKQVAEPANSCKSDSGVSFLDQVISPLYDVIAAEAANNDNGQAAHSAWRNYDDFNEYFWSRQCLQLGWPMCLDSPFFLKPDRRAKGLLFPIGGKHYGKTSFVEHRTFLHLYHSFHRLWIFLFMMFQGLAIIAFNKGNLNLETGKQLLSLGPTYFVMKFLESIPDILMMYGANSTSCCSAISSIICRFLWFTFVSLLISSLFVQTLQDGSDSIFFKIYVLAIGIYAAFKVFQSLLSRIPACHRLMLECDKSSVGHNFVGRGMYEKATDYIHYSLFWLVVLGGKFSFAYFLLIKPLVLPTQSIVKFDNLSYSWNDFSKNNHNALSILSLWAPVFCIYLLDTQLFYTIFSALYGFLIGAKDRLGEIRSVYAVHKFFGKFPSAFMEKLYLSQDRRKELITARQLEEQKKFDDVARFAPFWNEIIKNLREEDYITNLELDLLLMPKRCTFIPTVQWPMFLLARKIFKAMEIAVRKVSQDELWNIISRDEYMKYAVEECYYSVRAILRAILEFDNAGLSWVDGIFEHIEESIEEKSIQKNFQLSLLPLMISKITALTEIFRGEEFSIRDAVFAMKNLYDVVHRVILSVDTRGNLDEWNQISKARAGGLLFANLKWPGDPELKSQINRLHSLLAIESAENVPINLVARSRLEFFTNSLFMQMPAARPVSEMLSFCVLTPYYSETVLYSFDELQKKNEDGITILFYLQKIFPDEWKNFLSRIGRFENAAVFDDNYILELRFWASYRGQTLARTVRGMMYYRKALMLQSYLERLSSEGSEFTLNSSVLSETQGFELSPEARAQADIKFTYVVTCQIYGKQREERKPEAADIALLMQRNEALRVAYIDVVENLKDGKPFTEYFSKLVKADIHGKETEVYSVKLPGNPKLGEGKPENQNHAIIFTRGSALQTIDMNQDNYFEEALKMRNLLEEFHCNHGLRQPTILGVREHVFSGSVSSLASFMSNQETSFVTLGQRVLAKLLKVRMHYGHPDVFDRIFHITRGGISKASRVINISEDIYAGFNSTLRQGNITHHEYIQVGKGRDVGFNQIAFFEGKVAGGNGEQVLSRDVYRLGQFFDFFRMLSFYFTTVGFYFSTMLTVLTVYIFLYGKAYLAFSGAGEAIQKKADVLDNTALNAALNAQFLFQIGIFSAVPMILEFILEQGFLEAIISFAIMQLQFCCVFFTFSLGTRAHYFGRTILHGGAKYHATGRGFGVRHIKFAENYRLYSRSHFVKGLEVVLLLIVYFAYGYHKDGVLSYIKMSITSWFMALSWLFAPYAFNPSGFEWRKTKEDFQDWKDWLLSRGEIGIQAEKSWEAWWDEELAHIRTLRGRILETILSLRFLLFQYGIVYKLHASGNYTSLKVYGLSWIVVAVLFILVQVFTFCKKNFDNYQFLLRFCLITSVILVFGGLIFALAVIKIAVLDIFACCLAFLPTGWAILSIAVAWKPLMEKLHLWTSLRAIARVYDAGFGMFMFIPIAFLSLFPFVSTIQTRVLFNEAFSRGLEISHILAGENNPNTGS